MKKLFLSAAAVLLAGGLLFTLSSFHSSSAAQGQHASQWQKPEPIHILFNYNDGTFTCSGAVNTQGTWTMDVKYAGVTFHCINTLYAEDGSVLVAISHCNGKTMGGQWQITEGSGMFAGMKGNGSLMMTDLTEEWHGTIR